jgi:hypothetical protein
MKTVEDMNDELKNHNVFFMNFTRIYARRKRSVICFFEGLEDVSYYHIRIKQIYSDDWESLPCRGKKSVIDLYELLKKHSHKEYRNSKKAFFIDRDFDPPLPDDLRRDIYETPYYAIENFYISETCFREILKYGFNIQQFKDDEEESIFNQCVEYFKNDRKKFHDEITLLNIWIYLVREEERIKDISARNKLNLKDIKFDELFDIHINDIKCKYDIDYLNKKFPDIKYITVDKICATKDKIIRKGFRWQDFRGKYEIAFLGKYLRRLQEDLNNKLPKFFNKRKKIKFNITEGNILSELSRFADTPPCLICYLNNMKS